MPVVRVVNHVSVTVIVLVLRMPLSATLPLISLSGFLEIHCEYQPTGSLFLEDQVVNCLLGEVL